MASETVRASLRSASSSSRVCTSIVEPYKCIPLQNTRTQDVFQSIVRGRKSWKTLRGGEIVWPPELEAALLEGLESYQPDDSRETRLLGRFPMRNRFISDYIFNKTGKRRTAKQVGSRLQQLRDTCGGKRLLSLISPRRQHGPPSSRAYYAHPNRDQTNGQCESDSSSDVSSAPTTPTDPTTNFHGSYTDPSRTVVNIDLLPDGHRSPESPFNQENIDGKQWLQSDVRATQQPRHLRSIDPTITFLSQSPVSARSVFTVYSLGTVVFSETTSLESAGPAPESVDGALLYSTKLVPGFWSTISDSRNPTQYTIVQDVFQEGSSQTLSFSAVYKFNYAGSSPHHIHSPSISDHYDEEAKITQLQNSLALDCLLPLDSHFVDMDCEAPDHKSYYPFPAIESVDDWEVHSPSDISSDPSVYGGSQSSLAHDDEYDPMGSPVSVAFLDYASPFY